MNILVHLNSETQDQINVWKKYDLFVPKFQAVDTQVDPPLRQASQVDLLQVINSIFVGSIVFDILLSLTK